MAAAAALLAAILLTASDARLAPVQHTALMNVFEQLGWWRTRADHRVLTGFAGCAFCPRFAADAECPSEQSLLVCRNESVIAIRIGAGSLTGTLSEEIGELTGLTDLTIERVGLTGSLPRALSELTQLEFILFSKNGLTQTMPDLQRLSKLALLWLKENKLTGTLSSSLSSLPLLGGLDVQQNFFVGDIPRLMRSDVTCNVSHNCLACSGPCACLSQMSLSACPLPLPTAPPTSRTRALTTMSMVTRSPPVSSMLATSSSVSSMLATSSNASLAPSNASLAPINGGTISEAPATDAAPSSVPLIAGAVGGGVGLLFLIGVVVFVICRARRNRVIADRGDDDVAMNSAATTRSDAYGVVPERPQYHDAVDVRKPVAYHDFDVVRKPADEPK